VCKSCRSANDCKRQRCKACGMPSPNPQTNAPTTPKPATVAAATPPPTLRPASVIPTVAAVRSAPKPASAAAASAVLSTQPTTIRPASATAAIPKPATASIARPMTPSTPKPTVSVKPVTTQATASALAPQKVAPGLKPDAQLQQSGSGEPVALVWSCMRCKTKVAGAKCKDCGLSKGLSQSMERSLSGTYLLTPIPGLA
jgi:hypothetical protein